MEVWTAGWNSGKRMKEYTIPMNHLSTATSCKEEGIHEKISVSGRCFHGHVCLVC